MRQELEKEALKGVFTVAQISKLKGKPWTWVVRRIAPLKNQIQLPDNIRSLKDLEIPHDVFVQIDFIDESETPAGDWITTTTMANELEVEYKWVNRRILQIKPVGEFRICSNGSKLHFPPEALDELREIRNKAIVNIDPDNYFSVKKLSEIVGRHSLWVNNRLDNLNIEPILGLDARRKAVEYYPKCVLEILLADRDQYAEAEDRLTIPALSRQTGKDREWIEDQLEDIGAIGEYRRFSKSGRVDLCFAPEVLNTLLDRKRYYVNPEQDWCTKNALITLTGKSRNWVTRRLIDLKTTPKLFADTHGVLRQHYSPEVKDKLLKMARRWTVSEVFDPKPDEDQEGNADRFRDIYEKVGVTITIKGLTKLGVSQSELDSWMNLGLITRWKSGQYYFTERAKTVANRIHLAEDAESKLRAAMQEFAIWIDEDSF